MLFKMLKNMFKHTYQIGFTLTSKSTTIFHLA